MAIARFQYVNQDEIFTQQVFESLITVNASRSDIQDGRTSMTTHTGGIGSSKKSRNIEYLLLRPKNDGDERAFPKGHIEDGETVEQAA